MMPKLHSTNFENMELIRPLYLVKEEDIISWKNYNSLNFIGCACKLTENGNTYPSKREEVKGLISQFRKISPMIEMNIFRSVENINLDAIIAYKIKKEKHFFLDTYLK
ncbi:MAG: ATPase, partial [Clostridiales bacterium]|jgi:tRNA(Ile)-lysidine synthase TilS/MesJ|nr:ATPase [Clostridiales bacterium]